MDDALEKEKSVKKEKPKEVFLGKVNLNNLKKELGFKKVEDIGSFVKLSNPKNAYNWGKEKDNHGTRPSYNAIVQMLQNGATVESLFGVEYNRGFTYPGDEPIKPITFTDEEVAGFLARISDMVNRSKNGGSDK